jgi:hypothetical protein
MYKRLRRGRKTAGIGASFRDPVISAVALLSTEMR